MKAESVHAALLLMVVVGLGLAVFATLETYNPPAPGRLLRQSIHLLLESRHE